MAKPVCPAVGFILLGMLRGRVYGFSELAGIFAIEVCGYAVLDNHLHVLLRLEPE